MGDSSGRGRRVPLSREASKEFEEEYSEGSSDEGEGEGAMPSLSDQLQLLTPASLRQQQGRDRQDSPSQDPAVLYSTVNKRTKVSKSEGDGSTSKTVEKPRTSSLSEEPAQKSLFIHDLTPPWKQIVSICLLVVVVVVWWSCKEM